jgi:hypothetical protein
MLDLAVSFTGRQFFYLFALVVLFQGVLGV